MFKHFMRVYEGPGVRVLYVCRTIPESQRTLFYSGSVPEREDSLVRMCNLSVATARIFPAINFLIF
jgi:hypothetical protein